MKENHDFSKKEKEMTKKKFELFFIKLNFL